MRIDVDDVGLNKAAIVERCIRRIAEELDANPALDDFTHVDALTLNIERACQASIDLAMHVVATHRLGMPQSSADAFSLLRRAGLIDAAVETAMRRMSGFRNIAIHQYQAMDDQVLRRIAQEGWRDWSAFFESLGLKIKP